MIFDLIPTTIRMSTPLILTALGGIYSERSGVVNIFGNWKPLKVGVACIMFGFAGALELTGHWQIPAQLLNSFPYLLTMIVLIGVIDKSKPPASLGKH